MVSSLAQIFASFPVSKLKNFCKKECQVFLVHVISEKQEDKSPESVSEDYNIPDIFPKSSREFLPNVKSSLVST